jgi:hypothetical protein
VEWVVWCFEWSDTSGGQADKDLKDSRSADNIFFLGIRYRYPYRQTDTTVYCRLSVVWCIAFKLAKTESKEMKRRGRLFATSTINLKSTPPLLTTTTSSSY